MNGGNVVFHFKGDDKDLDKKTEGIASKFKSIGSAIGGAFVKGTAVAGATVAGLTTAFLGAGEASQEFTEDMGKLTTGFSNANKGLGTMEQAVQSGKNSYRDFVGILGETDQSVEAVNHLAKLTNSQAELSKWSTIAAGVYATFGDSLPIEGLTEAANETAKVGQVTGPLADALNWAGVSEDKFNQQLAACNSEQERSTLITNTLNGLYEKAGQKYQEVNKNLIEARQAQSDFNSAMAEVGQLAMPFTSALKSAGAGLLTSLVPGLKEVTEGVWGVVNGTAGASDKINSGFSNIINTLLSKFTSALPKVLSVGIQLITSLIQGVLQALPQVISALTGALPQLINAFTTLVPQVIQALAQALPQIITAIVNAIPQILQAVISVIPQIATALSQQLPTLIPVIVAGIIQCMQIFNDNMPMFLKAGAQIILGLIQGLINSLPLILQNLGTIITFMANFFTFSKLLGAGKVLLSGLGKGLIQGIPALIKGLPQIIKAMIGQLNGIGVNGLLGVGKNLIKGLWNGLNQKDWIVNKVKGMGKTIINAVKGIFGVHSPSRVFAWVGKMNMTGLYNGMEDMQPKVQQAIDGMFDLNPSLYGSTSTNLSPQVNVVNNVSMKQDPLGQMVHEIKTFSGGSKNDYNYGMGV